MAGVVQQRHLNTIDTQLAIVLHTIVVQVFPHIVAQAGRSPQSRINRGVVFAWH